MGEIKGRIREGFKKITGKSSSAKKDVKTKEDEASKGEEAKKLLSKISGRDERIKQDIKALNKMKGCLTGEEVLSYLNSSFSTQGNALNYKGAVASVTTAATSGNTVNVSELIGRNRSDSNEDSDGTKFPTRIRKSSIELWISKINSQAIKKDESIGNGVLAVNYTKGKEKIENLEKVVNGCFNFMKIGNSSSVKFFSSFGSSDKNLKEAVKDFDDAVEECNVKILKRFNEVIKKFGGDEAKSGGGYGEKVVSSKRRNQPPVEKNIRIRSSYMHFEIFKRLLVVARLLKASFCFLIYNDF